MKNILKFKKKRNARPPSTEPLLLHGKSWYHFIFSIERKVLENHIDKGHKNYRKVLLNVWKTLQNLRKMHEK